MIVVGTRSGQINVKLESIMASIGLPKNAFRVEKSEPVLTKTLSDTFIPPLGGVEIIKNSDGGLCTYGLGVTFNNDLGFITASHCTNVLGDDVTGNKQKFLQGNPARIIGTESFDPPNDTNSSCTARGYASTRVCRTADVAFMVVLP
jgi:hypothetical protein